MILSVNKIFLWNPQPYEHWYNFIKLTIYLIYDTNFVMIKIIRYSEYGFTPHRQSHFIDHIEHSLTFNITSLRKKYSSLTDYTCEMIENSVNITLNNLHEEYLNHQYGYWAFVVEPSLDILTVYLNHRLDFNYNVHRHEMLIDENTFVYIEGKIFDKRYYVSIKEAIIKKSIQVYIPIINPL